MAENENKKNTRAVEDFEDGVKGEDQEGLFSSRSRENEEGLKEKAKLDEQQRRSEESKEKRDADSDDE